MSSDLRTRARKGARLDAIIDSDDNDSSGPTAPAAPAPQRTAKRLVPRRLGAGEPLWIVIGLVLAGLGFVVIMVAWGQAAAQTQVYLQLPYVVSGGLTGVGLVLVGLAVLNVATRQRDAIQRDRQVARILTVLTELRDVLAEEREVRK